MTPPDRHDSAPRARTGSGRRSARPDGIVVLHAGWTHGRLAIWAEAPGGGTGPRGRRRYGAGAGELSRSLLDTPVPVVIEMKDAREIVAWLPTSAGRVIPSRPILGGSADPGASPAGAELAPWRIMAAPLEPDDAIVLLCACYGKRTLAPGVIIGADLLWWVEVVRFAGALVARQKFLPGIAQGADGVWRARWDPLITAEEADRISELARRMPGSARALAGPAPAQGPPSVPPIEIVKDAVGSFIDHIVRTAAADLVESRRFRTAGFDSIHDAWTYALRSPDGRIAGESDDLRRHAVQVREWRRPVAVSAAAPIRLCLRLEEPPAERSEPWFVRFLAQSREDPSLMVPLRDAWNGEAPASIPGTDRARLRESVLLALGQAATIDQRLASSLDTANVPDGYQLDAAGAHEFLALRAGVFEEAGFGVMLPAWWTGRGTQSRLTVRAKIRPSRLQAPGQVSLDEILTFDWEVALGDVTLSVEELESLARLKAPLLRVRGQWVELDAAEIEQAIAVWRRKGGDRATARDAIEMALGAKAPPGGFELAGVDASGWIGELLAKLEGNASYEELPPPRHLVGVLRPYQLRGYSWLAFLRRWGLGGCLADDMGLGKTVQALAMIQREWDEGDGAEGAAADRPRAGRRPVLIVCPTSVVNNWKREAERFTPDLPVMVHHGTDRKRGASFLAAAERHAIVISSYGLLQRDIDLLLRAPWAGVILDEAQNIKNPETKQARCARMIEAGYRFALTGTPVENNVGDLWSIMEFLNRGFLGTPGDFKKRFFVPIQASHDPDAAVRLRKIVSPFVLRRVKTDREIISDLPEKQEMKVFCSLTREQASLYAAIVKEAEAKLVSAKGMQRRGLILATISKLKQVCNHPAQFLKDNSGLAGRSGKLARLTEMLEETISVGDRALVFSQFAQMGEILRRHIESVFGREVLFLHGGVPKAQRDRMIDRFQGGEGDAPLVFVLSLKAGGTGLNLTAAGHVFHFDRWWNPAVENQATDRAFRIGQTRNVQVHKFICAGTLEERIDEMIESKVEIAERIIGAGEGWLTELSNTELKRLFALRAAAVGE